MKLCPYCKGACDGRTKRKVWTNGKSYAHQDCRDKENRKLAAFMRRESSTVSDRVRKRLADCGLYLGKGPTK